MLQTLMPALLQFAHEQPFIELIMDLSDQRANLREEGLDLSIRITADLQPGDIVRPTSAGGRSCRGPRTLPPCPPMPVSTPRGTAGCRAIRPRSSPATASRTGAWLAGHLNNWLAPATRGRWRAAQLPEGAFVTVTDIEAGCDLATIPAVDGVVEFELADSAEYLIRAEAPLPWMAWEGRLTC